MSGEVQTTSDRGKPVPIHGGFREFWHRFWDPTEHRHEVFDGTFEPYFRNPKSRFNLNGVMNGLLFADLDLSETDDSIEIEIDVPGVRKKDLDIRFNNGVLEVKGSRRQKTEETKKNYRWFERSYGDFERRIALPCDVEENHIDARLNSGVLKISLPKSQDAKKRERRIEVKAV